MKTEPLIKLVKASLELHKAEAEFRFAKTAYHHAWQVFESEGGEPGGYVPVCYRISRGDDRWDDAVDATKGLYQRQQRARRTLYNAKRRWDTACRKASEV